MREKIPHRDRREIDSYDISIWTVNFFLNSLILFHLFSHVFWHPPHYR